MGLGPYNMHLCKVIHSITAKWHEQAVGKLQMQNANVMTDQKLTSSQVNKVNRYAFPPFLGFVVSAVIACVLGVLIILAVAFCLLKRKR